MTGAAALGSAGITLLGLGLVMGTSPTLYALVLRLLTETTRPGPAIRWLTAGLALGTTLLLLVFRVVDPQTLTAMVTDRTETLLVRRSTDLVAGAVLLLLGVREILRLRRPRHHRAVKPPDTRSRRMVLTGFADAVIGVSGMATMYITGRVIASAGRGPVLEVLLYLVFLVPVVGPYLLLAMAWERFPGAAHRVTAIVDRLARMDRRPLIAGVLLLAGAAFLAMGIHGPWRPADALHPAA